MVIKRCCPKSPVGVKTRYFWLFGHQEDQEGVKRRPGAEAAPTRTEAGRGGRRARPGTESLLGNRAWAEVTQVCDSPSPNEAGYCNIT